MVNTATTNRRGEGAMAASLTWSWLRDSTAGAAPTAFAAAVRGMLARPTGRGGVGCSDGLNGPAAAARKLNRRSGERRNGWTSTA